MIFVKNGCVLEYIQMWKMGETTGEVSANKSNGITSNVKIGNNSIWNSSDLIKSIATFHQSKKILS